MHELFAMLRDYRGEFDSYSDDELVRVKETLSLLTKMVNTEFRFRYTLIDNVRGKDFSSY